MANQQVKIYCGTSDNLPDGYGRFGTRFECMRCGYGSAMMKYKWAPVSGDAKPPARARKGCYRARNPRKSPRKKSKGKKKRKRSPRKKKSKYLSRAQINKLIKEEMHRRQK